MDKKMERDDVPLADIMPLASTVRLAGIHKNTATNLQVVQTDSDDTVSDDRSSPISDYLDESDNDPTFVPGKCNVKWCKKDVYAACEDCLDLLCHDHFVEDVNSCIQHGKRSKRKKIKKKIRTEQGPCVDRERSPMTPEAYTVEGAKKEVHQAKMVRVNKQKEAKKKKNSGQEYISPKTKKIVPEKTLGSVCKETSFCQKLGRKCHSVTQEEREQIFQDYYKLSDLRLQREYIVRHIERKKAVKRSDTARRGNTLACFLTISGKRIHVCQKFFLRTLGISEKVARTALAKMTETGMVEPEKRGGRQSEKVKVRDELWREKIDQHIERFPRVESHYCRASTCKEYLHTDLTLPKMYAMFLEETGGNDKPSYSTYSRVFNDKNLGFHKPKKDQCSICMSFLNGTESQKEELRTRYTRHIAEKEKVRELKTKCKEMAQREQDVLCATFDLQQVIHLPISKENALFYKRRLANYNLTFYDVADGGCDCFTWHEGQSKRGSSEITTAIYQALKTRDRAGIQKAYLFSDGCPGQNKNSIFPTIMLYL